MNFGRSLNGIFLLVASAAAGFLLIWLPPQVVAQYQAVKEFGPFWTTAYFVTVGTGAAILLGLSAYTLIRLRSGSREKKQRRERRAKNPSALSLEERRGEIEENLQSIEDFRENALLSDEVQSQLRPLVDRLAEKRESRKLEVVAFGTISSGKSSLLNALAGRDVFDTSVQGGTTVRRQEIPWTSADRVFLVDTPGLAEVDGAEHVALAAEAARDADIVLLTVDGPLRDSEFRLLEKLGEMEKRLLICLNKDDWYSLTEREELLGQIASQTTKFISRDDVLAVRAKASMRLRVHVAPDGSESEQACEVPPDIGPLANRMMQIVRREGEELLLANLLLQSRGLVEDAKRKVRDAIDRRAWEIVDRYTWGAGGAAALSPTPVLDLLAGSAITAKMVVDLAGVYKQPVDMETAVNFVGQLGKNLIAILGVSAATPAVVSGVASVLKTVPGAGTIAGGVLQGVVQALVTRWIGAVFVEYFRNEMQQPEGGLAGLARRQWREMTSLASLQRFVGEARNKLFTRS